MLYYIAYTVDLLLAVFSARQNCKIWFEKFSDVKCLDTLYLTNCANHDSMEG